MATEAQPRAPLTRDRVLRAAIGLADTAGLEAVTMRNLAHGLGVEAMSLYHHVSNKEALLDGMVETLVAEVETEIGGFSVEPAVAEWMAVIRSKILAARRVMLRHRWAPTLLESRSNMPAQLMRYFDSMLGIMVEGGFDYDLAHHAMHALGSRFLGFDQELFKPNAATPEDANEEMLADLAAHLPYLSAMLAEVSHDDPDSTLGWCDDQSEFEFGLDIVLDGLERRRLAYPGL
ncbi:MAG: TetR/AcrR family transcriptional regulator C-terminal domain-containing protein [Acidimicrobiia bacterium]